MGVGKWGGGDSREASVCLVGNAAEARLRVVSAVLRYGTGIEFLISGFLGTLSETWPS